MAVANEVMGANQAVLKAGGRDMNFGCAIVARVVEGSGFARAAGCRVVGFPRLYSKVVGLYSL